MASGGPTGRERWAAAYAQAEAAGQVRDADFTTLSGVEVDPVYGPADEAADERMERIGWPGEYPFTRGLYPDGLPRPALDHPAVRRLRQRPADQRALPDDPGRRRRRAERGLRHADADGPRLRRPAQPGRGRALRGGDRLGGRHGGAVRRHRPGRGHHLDDHLRARRCRCSACTWWRPSGRASTSATLNGTLQTDIFKEYIAQKEWLFAPEPHLRLIGDLMEYCTGRGARRTSRSASPATTSARPGSTAAQELAFTLADGFGYVELGLSRGLDVDRFAPGSASSSTPTSTSSRRSPSSGRPGGSGPAGCGTGTARPRPGRSRCGSTPRPPGCR